jgi:hypothetical protein
MFAACTPCGYIMSHKIIEVIANTKPGIDSSNFRFDTTN